VTAVYKILVRQLIHESRGSAFTERTMSLGAQPKKKDAEKEMDTGYWHGDGRGVARVAQL